jgi:hypothetical protein
MNPIGGYLELELNKGSEFHENAIKLNTGRNALELILISRKYSKIYIPFYSCDVILEPVRKLNIKFEFYSIDINLEPLFDYTSLKPEEGFMYINYFGLKDKFINFLSKNCRNLIVDNSQSFYSYPVDGIDTYYSARKFFGVSDGAYLYIKKIVLPEFPQDFSSKRITHLLNRIESGPESGYIDFKKNEANLSRQPIKRMSALTQKILSNVDYSFVQERRKQNFLLVHNELSNKNQLDIEFSNCLTPMIYPFLFERDNLKQDLIQGGIYMATYWRNVRKFANKEQLEFFLAENILPLPIDQRYSVTDMIKMCQIIKKKI